MFPSQLKSQAPGSAEELRCLQMLNQQPEGSSLEELSSSQGCLKLASTIKAYVATVSPGPGEDGGAPGCPRASVSLSALPEQWEGERARMFQGGSGTQALLSREVVGPRDSVTGKGMEAWRDPGVTFNQGTFSSLCAGD